MSSLTVRAAVGTAAATGSDSPIPSPTDAASHATTRTRPTLPPRSPTMARTAPGSIPWASMAARTPSPSTGPGAAPDASMTDTVWVAGSEVGRGARVVLRPSRRADAQDLFFAGREATVEGVFHDVGGEVYLAVVVADAAGAEMYAAHGRYLYFSPDEVEVLA